MFLGLNTILYSEPVLNKKPIRESLDDLEYVMQEKNLDFKPKSSNLSLPNLSFLKYFVYALAVAALLVILYFLIKRFAMVESVSGAEGDLLLGETIPESEVLRRANIDALLKNEKDPKSIIRLLFLLVLQKLVRKELIKTEPSKTNRQYTQELINFSSLVEFKKLIRIYEEAWFSLHETSLKQVEIAQDLKSKISKQIL